jgi:hypothetical protein
VAFGGNDVLNVLDVKSMLDVERFRRVDIDARGPSSLYRDTALLAPAENVDFLRQCVERFGGNFEQATGRSYLRLKSGAPLGRCCPCAGAEDAETRAGLLAVVPNLSSVPENPGPAIPKRVSGAGHSHTLNAGELLGRREFATCQPDCR